MVPPIQPESSDPSQLSDNNNNQDTSSDKGLPFSHHDSIYQNTGTNRGVQPFYIQGNPSSATMPVIRRRETERFPYRNKNFARTSTSIFLQREPGRVRASTMDLSYFRDPATYGIVPPGDALPSLPMQCTGQKKAVVIGINYIARPHELATSIASAQYYFQSLITNHGFLATNVHFLMEAHSDARIHPTRANIIRELQWLTANAKANDSLVFYFAGHSILVIIFT